jgi:hypothetical protein
MMLAMNDKSLNNCMLDTGAGANMMSLKVMREAKETRISSILKKEFETTYC